MVILSKMIRDGICHSQKGNNQRFAARGTKKQMGNSQSYSPPLEVCPVDECETPEP